MANNSKIEWTQSTWNPITGCDKVSQGCKNCYAEIMHRRLMKMHPRKYSKPFLGNIQMHEKDLTIPMERMVPTVYFVNSMSDLFHPSVPFEFVAKVFICMGLCPHHTFQILTKRPERALEFFKEYEYFGFGDDRTTDELAMDFHPWLYDKKTHQLRQDLRNAGWFWDSYGDDDSRFIFENDAPLKNVWIGVSVEDQKAANERIPLLLQIPAAVRFLSCEPMLGPIDLSICTTWPPSKCTKCGFVGRGLLVDEGTECPECDSFMDRLPMIDWVIVGGESGHKARPMHPDWVRAIRDQCNACSIPFFFKQWGQWGPYEKAMALLKGDQALGVFDYVHVYRDGKTDPNPPWQDVDAERCEWMFKLGKHAAGNVLDGQTHLNYP